MVTIPDSDVVKEIVRAICYLIFADTATLSVTTFRQRVSDTLNIHEDDNINDFTDRAVRYGCITRCPWGIRYNI